MRVANLILFALASVPLSAGADRIPVGVIWNGSDVGDGERVVELVEGTLAKAQAVRLLDSREHRKALVQGGLIRQVQTLLASADTAFVAQKCGDAVKDYEAAEKLLLNDVPFARALPYFGPIERNLLFCYDALGRKNDATRAAERLSWTAGTNEDLAKLLTKYWASRVYQPPRPPVEINATPTAAQVWRNFQSAGNTPVSVPSGDPALDVVDIELPGHRRAHVVLGSEPINVKVEREDRLAVWLDEVRVVPQDTAVEAMQSIGRKVGAARLVVVAPDGVNRLQARWFNVEGAKWAPASLRVDSSPASMEKLAKYVDDSAPAAKEAGAAAQVVAAPKEKRRWGKWYTWVAAGAVVALVVGLLIAQNVGDDKLTIKVSH